MVAAIAKPGFDFWFSFAFGLMGGFAGNFAANGADRLAENYADPIGYFEVGIGLIVISLVVFLAKFYVEGRWAKRSVKVRE
jgi:H+/Cl- antiporter ClcA